MAPNLHPRLDVIGEAMRPTSTAKSTAKARQSWTTYARCVESLAMRLFIPVAATPMLRRIGPEQHLLVQVLLGRYSEEETLRRTTSIGAAVTDLSFLLPPCMMGATISIRLTLVILQDLDY
jgi:hypothetical protein